MSEGDQLQKALQYAWRLLSYRPRSCAELRTRLQRKGYSPMVIEQVIEQLESAGELDDMAFSRLWVGSREACKPMGRRRLQHELAAKGISPQIVSEVLAAYDEEKEYQLASELAREQWQKNMRRNAGGRGTRQDLQRLATWLERRGFSTGVIAKICRFYREQDSDTNS